jgi:hypothetical protein
VAPVGFALLSAALLGSADRMPAHRPFVPVTYAVIGDTPYGEPQFDEFADDLAEINTDASVRLILHLGDIKNNSARCDTSYFERIRADFDRSEAPIVYTPGDNEWTDCYRASNGGYIPSERLNALLWIFFADSREALKERTDDFDVEGAYVENVRWSQSGVEFGTLNVPGSNNDWLPWFDRRPRSETQVAEYTNRTAADLAWLDRIFASAEEEDAEAVVLAVQADMWSPEFSGPNDHRTLYDHYTDLVNELAEQSIAFGKPVLLLNGDSHEFVDDYPLADPARPYQKTMYGIREDVPNLHRITVNGGTRPCHEWLRLTIDPRTATIFSIERVRFEHQRGFSPSLCATDLKATRSSPVRASAETTGGPAGDAAR